MSDKNRKGESGFTLIETAVVMGIVIFLSAMALTYNRASERQLAVFKDQAMIVGLLNRAKSLAIQKYRNPDIIGKTSCAFGVHFSSVAPQLTLFQDLGDVYPCSSDDTNYRYDSVSSPPEKIESFNLDPRIVFSGLPGGGLDILFIPPELNVTSTLDLPAAVVLETTDGQLTTTITISVGGQIISE